MIKVLQLVIIVARVNFSGVKEDKCGDKEGSVSLIKLTTCRFD